MYKYCFGEACSVFDAFSSSDERERERYSLICRLCIVLMSKLVAAERANNVMQCNAAQYILINTRPDLARITSHAR